MKRFLLASVILAALILTACGVSAAPTQAPAYREGIGGGAPGQPVESFPLEAPLPPGAEVSKSSDQYATSNVAVAAVPQDRLVIQNADLVIVVKDPEIRMKEIGDLAKQMGGFVVSSNLYQSFYGINNKTVPEATIVIRVPSEKMDDALKQIKDSAVEVQSENRSGQDVTSQYVDLQSQLKAKQAAEAQLLKIMEQAIKTEDVLAVYQQLQQIQSEIEVLKGQIKYYEEAAALSAISVRLIAEESTQPIEVGGWKPQGVAREAIQDLVYFLQGFANFLIRFFLFNLWVLLLIGLPIYLVFLGARALFRRVRKPKVKKEQTEEVKK